MPPDATATSPSEPLRVLVMAPQLGADLGFVTSVDPRVEVLDGNAAFAAELAEHGLGREPAPRDPPSPAERDALLASADVLLIGFPIPPRIAARAPHLAWIHHSQAGVSNLVETDLWTSPALLTSSRGAVATRAIAEYAIAGVLYFARGLSVAARHEAGTASRRDEYQGLSTVQGSTLGVVGLGGIGAEVARLGRALGMRVVATRRSVAKARHDVDGVDLLLPAAALDQLAAESDFVVLCSQLTAETEHMVGPRVLAAMRPGSVLVNVARGEEVDEDALLAALDAGRLRGAVLDVYDGEMAGRPPRKELLEHPAVLFTPHVSGAGDPTGGAPVKALFADNLRRFLHGEPLRNLVERDRGY